MSRASGLLLARLLLAVLAGLWASSCREATPPEPAPGATAAPGPAASVPEPSPADPSPELPPARPIPPLAAVEVVDLATGQAVFTQRGEVLDRPTWMASVAKVFVLRAALDAGVVDARTRIPCRGRVTLGPRTVQCVHTAFGRPLSAVEALAHSCNTFFISLRLPPGAVGAAFAAAGLPPPPAAMAESRLAWLGLDGTRVSPRRALRAFVTVVEAARQRRAAGDVLLLDGLREAARVGTANEFTAAGIEALAKTGTASLGDGTFGGIAVAVAPASGPRHAVVALGVGIAGRDAAGIAASALRRVGSAEAQGRQVRVGRATASGYVVEALALEDYVAGVVSAEATPAVGAPAREALAIAARSYVLAMAGRHARDGFDVCDLTHCQAHRAPDAASRAAARATAGRVLRFSGVAVPAFHHASCGGVLESPRAVWGGDEVPAELMPARPDPAGPDHGEPWREQVSAADLLGALRAGGHRGDELRGVTVARRSASGRVAVIRLDGLVPPEVAGERFRAIVGRALGWHALKSSLYEVTRTARGYRFEGRGRGHGVGLCVEGAARLAAHGHDATAILAAYFPGASLDTLAPAAAGFRLELPAAHEGERGELEAAVQRQLSAVLRASEVEALPSTVAVRFHESVRGYQRASRQPWWTAGATRDGRVHLLPIDVLRRRGLLERTVRHELAHVVTAGSLAGRPRWVLEGVARHLAGDRAPGEADGASCPPDEEFAGAVSAAALERLYDRALACVQRELTRVGGDWRALAD